MTENTTPLDAPLDPAPSPARAKAVRKVSVREAQDDVPTKAVDRRNPGRMEQALERARMAARIADDNRAKDILVLDLRQATPLLDYFVIATANSRRQSQAIAFEIDAEMKKIGELKLGMEGVEEGRWTLIDYGDFVVHVFSADARTYYALEEIWGDAPQLEWREEGRVPRERPAESADEPPADDEAGDDVADFES
ncbi:Ribosomal silencing factor RsfS [Aquisphaera giovannonii]|uniref:Ribosomal silencing factor RsfS n=1 Tax=Aquisphaera giovannonii TaxID=406548 RepID=A0A5B9WBG9_9BACT|nr:ribosome silencing factor [Aquisphaera giovannonii]QEH37912.1 Ribosomal silencing factor RsfS [Aquisphaera giovannonii]